MLWKNSDEEDGEIIENGEEEDRQTGDRDSAVEDISGKNIIFDKTNNIKKRIYILFV